MSLESRLRSVKKVPAPDSDLALGKIYARARRRRALQIGLGLSSVVAVGLATSLILGEVDNGSRAPVSVTPAEKSMPPAKLGIAALIAYASSRYVDGVPPNQEGVWLYDVSSDRKRRLVASGSEGTARLPSIRNTHEVSFVLVRVEGPSTRPEVHESFNLIDISTGQRRELFSSDDTDTRATAWSNDGLKMAFISRQISGEESHNLQLFDATTRTSRLLRALGPIVGRGFEPGDELSITWSADGASLLVVDTHLAAAETIQVIDVATGRTRTALSGTHALWSPDERIIYFRERESDPERPARWFSADLVSGSRSALGARRNSHHATLSGDGRYIAYVYGENPPEMVVYVYDLRTATEKRIAEGYTDPIWLRPDSLVATAVRSCGGPICDSPLVATGTSRFLTTGKAESTNLGSTFWSNVDVFYR